MHRAVITGKSVERFNGALLHIVHKKVRSGEAGFSAMDERFRSIMKTSKVVSMLARDRANVLSASHEANLLRNRLIDMGLITEDEARHLKTTHRRKCKCPDCRPVN